MRRSRSGFQGKRQFQNSAVIKYIGNFTLHAWLMFYYFFVVDYLNFEVHINMLCKYILNLYS